MRYLYFLPLILALVSTAFAADRASYRLTVYSADSSRSRYRGTFSFSIDQQEEGKTYYNRQKKDFSNWSSYLVIEGVAPEASGSFTLSVPGVLSLPAGPDQHVTLETSWTNEGTYEKDLQIVITYFAGDIEDDPDPDEPTDPLYTTEPYTITNDTLAAKTYYYNIAWDDGTVTSDYFTLNPGESMRVRSPMTEIGYEFSVFEATNDGGLSPLYHSISEPYTPPPDEPDAPTPAPNPDPTLENPTTGEVTKKVDYRPDLQRIKKTIDKGVTTITEKIDTIKPILDDIEDDTSTIVDVITTPGEDEGVDPEQSTTPGEVPQSNYTEQSTGELIDSLQDKVVGLQGLLPNLDVILASKKEGFYYSYDVFGQTFDLELDFDDYPFINYVREILKLILIILFIFGVIKTLRKAVAS